VVLIKVCSPQGTSTQDIVEGFQWAVQNRDKYNIRILNVSLGSHQDISFRESEIDRAAELAVHAGITVVAAAGNDPHRPTTPPGNSPSVITVGGTDDQNQLNMEKIQMYWSSFGRNP
jgi:serine protease AprX